MENYPVAAVATSLLEMSIQYDSGENPRGRDNVVALAHHEDRMQLSVDAATAVEKLAKRAETTALAVIAAEAIVAMALSVVAAGDLDDTAQETLLVAQRAAAKTLKVAKEDAQETLALAQEVAKELLAEARRKRARNA
jgi:hypothetical protein